MINMLLYQILAFIIHRKIKKSHKKIINLKYLLLHGMKSLNYLMGHILYQIFKITLNTLKKKHVKKTNNSPIRIYVNKIENRITFKIKSVYYHERLTPEKIKLLGNSKSKITKDKDWWKRATLINYWSSISSF